MAIKFERITNDSINNDKPKGKMRDVYAEVLDVDVDKKVIKVKEVNSEREYFVKLNEKIHSDVKVRSEAKYQGNLIDERMKKEFSDGQKIIIEGVIDRENDENTEKYPYLSRWLGKAPNQYTDKPKVKEGPITVQGYTKNEEFKPTSVILWSETSNNEKKIYQYLNESMIKFVKDREKYKNGEKSHVETTPAIAFLVLDNEGKVLQSEYPIVNQSVFDKNDLLEIDVVKELKEKTNLDEEEFSNTIKYAPIGGEGFKAAYEAILENARKRYGDDVTVTTVLGENFRPSNNLKNNKVQRNSKIKLPLGLDDNGNPEYPRFGGNGASIGIVSISPGDYKPKNGKIEIIGAENEFANHVYCSGKLQTIPEALGMELSDKYLKALEIHNEELKSNMSKNQKHEHEETNNNDDNLKEASELVPNPKKGENEIKAVEKAIDSSPFDDDLDDNDDLDFYEDEDEDAKKSYGPKM